MKKLDCHLHINIATPYLGSFLAYDLEPLLYKSHLIENCYHSLYTGLVTAKYNGVRGIYNANLLD